MAEPIFELRANILKALSHPARVQIVEFLKDNKLCACEMAPILGIEQSNFSRHISAMRSAGLLRTWKDGVRLFFDVTDPCVYDLLENVNKILKRRIKSEQQVIMA